MSVPRLALPSHRTDADKAFGDLIGVVVVPFDLTLSEVQVE